MHIYLTRMQTIVIFAELFWNPAQMLQGEDRAHRIGRKGTVSIKYVLADGTLGTTLLTY